MLQDQLIRLVSGTVKALGLPETNFTISHPGVEAHGDYAANIAMTICAKLKFPGRGTQNFKNPRELAQVIVDELNKNKDSKKYIAKIEIAGPGFINFWITQSALIDSMRQTASSSQFLQLSALSGKKVMVEYTDPNPFKEFHIGHLYSNIVGESLVRLHEALGAKVKRACYQGDIGMHVAKSVWGMRKKLAEKQLLLNELAEKPLIERQHFMGQAYALGQVAFEESDKTKDEMKLLNKKIYELDPDIKELYEMGRKWSLEYFETIYQRLGTKFDYYYFESETGKNGLMLVKKYLAKGVFADSEGAVVFDGKKYGLHTRVFINSLGLPTYEAKDLGLAPTKYVDFPYDFSFIVTGNEVNEYFAVVFKALELINPDLAHKTKHIGHGMVRLPSGKMSSRTGNVLTGEWLLDETKRKMVEYIGDSDKIKASDKEHVAEVTTVGAVKYSLLKSGIGKDTIFDFNESLSFEGNSGPYLQYTYARAQSVLLKSKIPARNRYAQALAGGQNPKFQTNPKSLPAIATLKRWQAGKIQSSKLTPEELSILRALHRFPEVILEAGTNLAPNLICNYLFDLAQKFNLFYQKIPILNAPDEKKQFRLLLTQAVAHTLKNGLYLLGIDVLEQM